MKSKSWLLPKNLNLTEHETKRQYNLKDFLKQIDLSKAKFKKIKGLLHGAFQSNRTGSGFNFNEIREYKIGDDLRHISWSATAKTNNLQTKEYFTEKEIRSYFLIDISYSMFCGNKAELFINLLAFLLNLTSNFSEKIGGLFFTDDIRYNFPLSYAHSQANIMFQTVIDFFNNIGNQQKSINTNVQHTNILKALEFTKKYFTKNG